MKLREKLKKLFLKKIQMVNAKNVANINKIRKYLLLKLTQELIIII